MSYYYSGYKEKYMSRRIKPARPGRPKRRRALPIVLMLVVFGLLPSRPVLGPAVSAEHEMSVIDPLELRARIEEILPDTGERYGLSVRVFETGEQFDYGEGTFKAASCYKLPLALLVYDMVSTNSLSLEDSIAIEREDWEAGTGVLQATPAGTEFSVRKLVQLSLVESDNIAANALLRTLGRETLEEFYLTTGSTVEYDSENLSCPYDMAQFAEAALVLALDQPDLGKELLSDLMLSAAKDRIARRIPEEIYVANKIGTLPGTVNDTGLIFAQNVTYSIAVMSDGAGNPARGAAVIGDVSEAVYEHITEHAKAQTEALGIGVVFLEDVVFVP